MRNWIAILCVFAFAFNASGASAGKRVALIVANGAYKDAALPNPTFDADLVASSLTQIGFDVKVVKNTSLEDFDAAVNKLVADADGADVALFYFAGHGFAVDVGLKPVSILMSTSADVTSHSERVLRAGGIPLDDIVSSLANKSLATLVFVDACRNGPRASRGVGSEGRGFAALEAIRGGRIFIGLSTRLGETAHDGKEGQGSPFARAFAVKITTPGLRIDDAFRELRDVVSTETEGQQFPDIVQDDLPGGAITLVDLPKPQALDAKIRPAGSSEDAELPVAHKLSEAAEIWTETLQSTQDNEALKLFVKSYKGTFYADLANQRLRRLSPIAGEPASEPAAAASPMADDCDILAASPSDPMRPKAVEGVDFGSLDPIRAIPACRKALQAKAGDPRLMFQLARTLQRSGSMTEALKLYRQAVGAGYAAAKNGLANLYAHGAAVSQDEQEAALLYRQAAEAGDQAAMNNLGSAYLEGAGVVQNQEQAAFWYRRAVDAGEVKAMGNLAALYADGIGVEKDEAEALRWARKAAAAGDAHSMSGLGVMYEKGLGLDRDIAQSESWYRRAAALGDRFAISALKRLALPTATVSPSGKQSPAN